MAKSDHLPAFRRVLPEEAVEQRHFFDAGRAPGGPEIQQQRLAAQRLHRQGRAGGRLEAERPERGRRSGWSRCRAATSTTPGRRRPARRRPRRRRRAADGGRADGPADASVAGFMRPPFSSKARTAAMSPRGARPLASGLQRAAHVVVVVDHQVHADGLAQLAAHAGQAQGLHRLAVEARDRARPRSPRCSRSARSRPTWDRRRTAGCRCPTAGWPCRARPRRPGRAGTAPAAPSRSAPAGAAPPVPPAGCRRRTARCIRAPRLPGLSLSGRRAAGVQPELLDGAALGRPVFQALFHHHAGGGARRSPTSRCPWPEILHPPGSARR